jgi:hypothetical protein
MTCAFERMDNDYKKLYNEKKYIGWIYLGAYNGVYRGYPF